MKRIISCLVSLAILLSLNSTVFAMDINTTSSSAVDTSADVVFIYSHSCPTQYSVFAEETVGQFLNASEFAGLSPCYLGTPFTFANAGSDIYYFPIYYTGEIICILRVYSDANGNISGVLSKGFAEELNAVAESTSATDPLKIFFDGTNVVFETQKNKRTVFSYPTAAENRSVTSTIEMGSDVFGVIECSAENSLSIALPQVSVLSTVSSTHLDLFGSEGPITQPTGYSWCAAYASSAIMRYKGLNVYAEDLMTYWVGDNPQPTDSISREAICQYANVRGFVATLTYSTLSYTRLCNEIDNDRPVYLSMQGTGTNTDSYHAIVLCGYDNVSAMLRIWNPWYNYYETIYSLNNYVPFEHQAYTFAYYATIYNWKRV